ncbi:MAG: FKBP-type peptidyl-prolyl cis-trans isomerase N-terminal domain-containing protein, partial [Desulfocapsa sp.]|nr:FKBP-type peptidyl-prolyl cis-trans isomerase N-terminal domain-containing protein [Desulfocapsa sp.]
MKRIAGLGLVVCLSLPTFGLAAEKTTELTTFKDKLSYSMGVDMGTYLNGVGEELNLDGLQRGLKDGFAGKELLLSTEEMQSVQKEFAEKMQAKQEAQLKDLQEKNKKEGEAYLADNKAKEGVVV